MEKFLSYAPNDISSSTGIDMHVISLPMIFLFLQNVYPMNQRRPEMEGVQILGGLVWPSGFQ